MYLAKSSDGETSDTFIGAQPPPLPTPRVQRAQGKGRRSQGSWRKAQGEGLRAKGGGRRDQDGGQRAQGSLQLCRAHHIATFGTQRPHSRQLLRLRLLEYPGQQGEGVHPDVQQRTAAQGRVEKAPRALR